MAKRLKKGEKLDLILGELSKLKGEVAKLSKQQAALVGEFQRLKSRAAPNSAPQKASKKESAPAKPGKTATQARKIPVLVKNENPPQSASGGS